MALYFSKVGCQMKKMQFIYVLIKIDFLDTCSYFLPANQNMHLATHNQNQSYVTTMFTYSSSFNHTY